MFATWRTGERRLNASIVCCATCGSLDVFRRGSKDGVGHWRCRTCAAAWTEPLAIGRGKDCNAKIATAPVNLDGQWTPGQTRVEAEAVCCPGCGCTKVRRSNARTLVAYWYCGHCGRGWNELAQVGRVKSCRVKLTAALAGHDPWTVAPARSTLRLLPAELAEVEPEAQPAA